MIWDYYWVTGCQNKKLGLCGSAVEERLYVSDAFHDVKIEVTEEGTKAAATTGEESRVRPRCRWNNEIALVDGDPAFNLTLLTLQRWCFSNDPAPQFSRRTGPFCFSCGRLTQVFNMTPAATTCCSVRCMLQTHVSHIIWCKKVHAFCIRKRELVVTLHLLTIIMKRTKSSEEMLLLLLKVFQVIG